LTGVFATTGASFQKLESAMRHRDEETTVIVRAHPSMSKRTSERKD
jgi:hypothetical protein